MNCVVEFSLGRGWIPDINTGTNTSYYLCSVHWYRTVSPNRMWSTNHFHMISVGASGDVGGHLVDDSGGGVRIFVIILIKCVSL